MALRDKLGKLSEEIAAEKQAAQETEQNENLKPIRATIKSLEKEKLDLEMMKNSLDFKKQAPEDGLGMKEYANVTGVQKKKTRAQLEEIATENTEALEKMGIKNIDELAENPEFSEDEEVVAYKKALDQEAGVLLSDTKLKNRLAKLGLEMNDANFSYEAASREIGLRLEKLEKELAAEKLKTPEGRDEVINKLAEEFSKNTDNIFWTSSSMIDKEAQRRSGQEYVGNSYYEFSLSQTRDYRGEGFRLEFIDDNKSKIDNYSQLPILPKNFSEQVDKYGLDIAEAALKKTYAEKVDQAFMDENGPSGRHLKMRSALETVSSEKRKKAEESLRDFDKKKKELLNTLHLKSEELRDKGVDFSSTYASGYGGEYKEIFKFSQDRKLNTGIAQLEGGLNGDIINALKSGKPLFPDFDLNKLTVLAERRISELDHVIEVVKNINDQSGVDSFINDRKSPDYIGNFHKQSLDFYFEDINYKNPDNISYQEMSALASRANNWQEAVEYLEKEIAQAEEVRGRTHKKMDELVDYYAMMYKLSAKNKSRYSLSNNEFSANNNQSYRLQDLSDYINRIEGEKKSASYIMAEIASLKVKLSPEDEVSVSGRSVKVKAKTLEYERLSGEIKKKDKEIDNKKSELHKEENSEPWLGKEKWRNKIAAIRADIDRLNQEEASLKLDYDKNVKEAFHYLNTEKITWQPKIKELIENYRASGKASEVFSDLETRLMGLVDQKIPAEVQADFDKLSDLETRLLGKK